MKKRPIIGGYIGYSYAQTEHDIATYAQNVIAVADKYPSPEISSHHLQKTHTAHLPEPVQAYFNYVFPKGAPSFKTVKFAMQGQFRRPLMETFEPTSAEQTIAVATPALVFSATTPIVPFIWAKAYDAYINGEMDMKAKILSTVTVMEERETPELNRISLRRWLIESPVYPMALLPGGPVRWQAIDDKSARAIISAHGQTASMVATFHAVGIILFGKARSQTLLSNKSKASQLTKKQSAAQKAALFHYNQTIRKLRPVAGAQHIAIFPCIRGIIQTARNRHFFKADFLVKMMPFNKARIGP